MAFEVGQCYKNIRIHDGTADFCLFYIFAPFYRNINFIRTF